ncbi:uncharacterized protein [Ptychodera flava]|uniref:uncharacterized protein isoform X2 n=1 Tax=Ptychodera flava TaxID=63121 RepID=UPI00396A5B83
MRASSIFLWQLCLNVYVSFSGASLPTPSFSSDWLRMRSQDESQSYIAINHNLNELPIFVQVHLRAIDGANDGFIFNGVGSAQRGDTTSNPYGGVVYTYNENWVRVMAPQKANRYASGCLIYTGGRHWGSPHKQCSHDGEVKVEVWISDNFPSPGFVSDWFAFSSNQKENSFKEIEHNLGQQPSMVRVQYQDTNPSPADIGFTSDGFGSAQCDDDVASKEYGGIVFAYNKAVVRIWAPSSTNSKKFQGHLFFAGSGWGNGVNSTAFDDGIVRIIVWAGDFPDPDFKTDGDALMGVKSGHPTYLTFEIPPGVIGGFLLLEGLALNGRNEGFSFEGVGAQQTCSSREMNYGGIIYAYNDSYVRVWAPTTGPVIRVGDGWGKQTGKGNEDLVDVTVKVYRAGVEGTTATPALTATDTIANRQSTPTQLTTGTPIKITDGMLDILDQTKNFVNVNSSTMDQKVTLGKDVLRNMERVLLTTRNDQFVEQTENQTKVLTTTIISIVKLLSKFILSGKYPISGSLALNTSAFVLYLESDSPDVVCDRAIMLLHGSGFYVPPANSIFQSPVPWENISVIIFQMISTYRYTTQGHSGPTTELLILEFLDPSFDEIQVNNVSSEFGIYFGNLGVSLVDGTMVGEESFASELKRVSRWILRNLRSYHAVKIVFHSSETLNGNTTVFMSKGDCSDIDNYYDNGTFSATIEFKGNTANLFIPEYMMTQPGNYCLSCKLNTNTGSHFTLVVTQHKCSFWEEQNGTWDTNGCRVSSKSNINSTVCLCNHLTAFTSESTIGTKKKQTLQVQ